ncbi:hypothetical protein CR513_05943, partial [Mucuna pruriens]
SQNASDFWLPICDRSGDNWVFNKISNAYTTKEAWEILVKTYGDGEKNKKKEYIADYFDRIQKLVNAKKACKENISYQQVVDKILRTLPPRFDHVIVAIEESKDLNTMEIKELEDPFKKRHFRHNAITREKAKDSGKGISQTLTKNTKIKHLCIECKQTRGSFSKFVPTKATKKLRVIHFDVYGPMQIETPRGSKFKCLVEKQNGKVIKVLRTDGGGEYVSNEFKEFYESEGLIHEVTPPYICQHNSTTERRKTTLLNLVRCMLKSKKLPS